MADQGFLVRVRFHAGGGPLSILDSLLASGWKPDDDGVVRYLPVGDDDYDWNAAPVADLPRVMAEIRTKEKNREAIGLVLTFEDTAVGGEWLFLPNGDVAFTPSVNRKTTEGRSDVGWYLHRILPAFQRAGAFDLDSWRWEENP